jgi:AcrR family transcriptional regulator
MKTGGVRPYKMRARAEAAEATGDRIREAAVELFSDNPFDDVSLDMIAERAGVTTRTVIRRFGSKEELFVTSMDRARDEAVAQRNTAPVGDVAGIVRNVVEHYERWGNNRLRMIEQEEKIAVIADNAEYGRRFHRDWVTRVFAPMLEGLTGRSRERRVAALILLTDVFTWRLLRKDLGLSRRETEGTIVEIVNAALKEER